MTTDKLNCTLYFEKEEPRAVSFTLPRGVVQFHKLETMTEEEIVELIRSDYIIYDKPMARPANNK